MSSKNKLKRKSNVNLFFNQQMNIFPEDFFSTFDKKSNSNKDKNKQNPHPKIILPKFKENLKTDLYSKSRNQNINNEEWCKDNFTNVIRLDNINNLDFSFKAPSIPDKKNIFVKKFILILLLPKIILLNQYFVHLLITKWKNLIF